ncbi:hypothetical protein SH668x_001661 [Planctomicrobium sp. SH668]|uniref:hypothetical protein n=1 Tax=Planctomicrobium sp. SH668 TaxID=3448126 RepID=UPI003F5AFC5F
MDAEEEGEDVQIAQAWYDRKSKYLEKVLGPQDDMVMHSLFPYAVGGALDLYYYPKSRYGTAFVTKELCEQPTGGPSNDQFDAYELVMFTRHPIDLEIAMDEKTPFGKVHRDFNMFMNHIARYAEEATLNRFETCEFPKEMEVVGGRALAFGTISVAKDQDAGKFGLLILIEIFRSELKFARKEGTEKLMELLKEKRHFPFSDMDRKPVVESSSKWWPWK